MKLIISDMDGTIIAHELKEKICRETIKSINNLSKSKEIIFNIATGRHYLNVLNLLKKHKIEMNKRSFIIGMNGSQVYSFNDKKLIRSDVLDINKINESKLIQKISKKYFDEVLIFGYSVDNEIFFVNNKSNVFKELKDFSISYEDVSKPFIVKDIENINEIKGVYKFILFFSKAEDIKKVQKKLSKKFKCFSFVKTGPNYIEIIDKNINKAVAIKYINDNYFNLKKDDIISFGDSENDLEMFAFSGKSFTREDADENIKKAVTNVLPHKASYFVHYGIQDISNKNKKNIRK